MPKPKDETKAKPICRGGVSYNCRRDEHPEGGKSGKYPNIFCFRCDARLGCGLCCERASELLCLRCHDWGTRLALKKHGSIVHDQDKKMIAMRIVKMRLAGKVDDQEAAKLFAELWGQRDYIEVPFRKIDEHQQGIDHAAKLAGGERWSGNR